MRWAKNLHQLILPVARGTQALFAAARDGITSLGRDAGAPVRVHTGGVNIAGPLLPVLLCPELTRSHYVTSRQ